MFYTFVQNNSGGYYIQNEDVGAFVIIEGNDCRHITERAKDIFEDYSEYCSCCGERWEFWMLDDDEDLDKIPMIYEHKANEYKEKWYKGDKIIIHYLDGTKECLTIMEEEIKREKQEAILNRGKDVLALSVDDDEVYFIYGLDRYKMPSKIESYTIENDTVKANHKSGFSMAFRGDSYIVFIDKEDKRSDRFNIKLGSKVIYEKCLEFVGLI